MIDITDDVGGGSGFNAVAAGSEKNLTFIYRSVVWPTSESFVYYDSYGDIPIVDKPFEITRADLENARLISNVYTYKSTLSTSTQAPAAATRSLQVIRDNALLYEFPIMFTGNSAIEPPTTYVVADASPDNNGGIVLNPGEGYDFKSELVDSLGSTGVGTTTSAGYVDYDIIDPLTVVVDVSTGYNNTLDWWSDYNRPANWLTPGISRTIDMVLFSANGGNNYESYATPLTINGNYLNFRNITGNAVLTPPSSSGLVSGNGWSGRQMEICRGALTPDGKMIVLSNVVSLPSGYIFRGGIQSDSSGGQYTSFPGINYDYATNGDLTLRIPSFIFYREVGREKWCNQYVRSYGSFPQWSYAQSLTYSNYTSGYANHIDETETVSFPSGIRGPVLIPMLTYSTQVQEVIVSYDSGGSAIYTYATVNGLENAKNRSAPPRISLRRGGFAHAPEPTQLSFTGYYPTKLLLDRGYTTADLQGTIYMHGIYVTTDPSTWNVSVVGKGYQLPAYYKFDVSPKQDARASKYKTYVKKRKFYGPQTPNNWDLAISSNDLQGVQWSGELVQQNVTLPTTNTTKTYSGNYYGQFIIPDGFDKVTLRAGDALLNGPSRREYRAANGTSSSSGSANGGTALTHQITISIPSRYV